MKYLNQFIRPVGTTRSHTAISLLRKGKTELKETIQQNSVYISEEIIKSSKNTSRINFAR